MTPPRPREPASPFAASGSWTANELRSSADDENHGPSRAFDRRDGPVLQHATSHAMLQLDEIQPSKDPLQPSSVYYRGTTTASVGTTATTTTTNTTATTTTTSTTSTTPTTSATAFGSSVQSSSFFYEDSTVTSIQASSVEIGPHSDVRFLRQGSDESEKPHYDSLTLRLKLQHLLYRRNSALEARLEGEVRRRLACVCQDTPLLLVSGASASGKTQLATSIRHFVEAELGGYFVTGRFDPAQGSAPYPAYVSALQDFRDQVMARGPHEIMRVRRAVKGIEGLETSLLTRFFPGLVEILETGSRLMEGAAGSDTGTDGVATESTSPPAPVSSGAILRFTYVFGSFFRAIGSPDSPLVLLIDDLNFADPGSINLLVTGVINESSPGFLVIGTVETERVSANSPLTRKLREIEDQCATLVHLSINNLGESELFRALEVFFHWIDPDETRVMLSLLHRRSLGDILFVTELMCWLYETKALSFDPTSEFWAWDFQQAYDLLASCSSLDALLSKKISVLPDETVQLLQVASCLGMVFDETLIEYALGRPIQNAVEQALSRGGLISYEVVDSRRKCRFCNGSIQRIANQLIPDKDRLVFHLEIGRRIWRRLDECSMEKNIFQVLNLLRAGQDLIRRQKERHAVASMCLHAGTMAARSSAFLIASHYLSMGIALLGPRRWREDYELALALHNAGAEMGICSGNLEAMESHVNSVLANARQFHDTMHARMAKFYSYGMQAGRYYDAFEEGKNLLRYLGVRFPAKYSKVRLVWELLSVRRLVRGKSDQFFMRMPALLNSEKRFCLQILTLMCQYGLFSTPNMLPFVILRMMKITVLNGNSEFASTAIVSYGMLCIAAYGDVDMGYRFGRLGLAIFDRDGPLEFLPRVHGTFFGHVLVSKRPIAEMLQPVARAYRIGVHTGDLQGAFLCANIFCIQLLEAGVRLSDVEPELDSIQEQLEATNQKSMSISFLPLSRIVRDLMGSPTNIAGWGELRRVAEESGVPLDTISVMYCQLALAWVHDDFEHVDTMMNCIRHFSSVPQGASRVGLLGLIGAYAMGLAQKGIRRTKNVRLAKKMIKQLLVYATLEPSNAQPRLHLVQGELAAHQGRNGRAHQKYLTAIALSAATNCRHVCAKANECFARHLYRTSGEDAARIQDSFRYFAEACRIYKDWGGILKYRSLSLEMEELFPGSASSQLFPSSKRPSLRLALPKSQALSRS